MKVEVTWLCFVIIFTSFLIDVGAKLEECKSDQKSDKHRLRKKLLCGYDKTARPVKLYTNPTSVEVDFLPNSLHFFHNFNEMDLYTTINWVWKDEFLTWNSSDYGNIKKFIVHSENIWVPEISHNTGSMWNNHISFMDALCTLWYTGWVYCSSDKYLSATCRLDLTNWPYDTQVCSVKLSAITESEEEIDLVARNNSENLIQYATNHEWSLQEFSSSTHHLAFNHKVFPIITYKFVLRRTPVILQNTLVIPATVFGLLILSTFWLGEEPEARLYLCSTLLFCHFLLLFGVGYLQNGDNAPLIVIFCRDSAVLCYLSLILAAFTKWMTSWSADSLPSGLKTFVMSKPSQMLFLSLLFKKLPQGSVLLQEEEEEDGNLLPEQLDQPTWSSVSALLDRVSFILYCLIYVILICVYVM